MALLAAAMIAAYTTEDDSTNPIWKEASLQELGAMEVTRDSYWSGFLLVNRLLAVDWGSP